MTTPGTSFYRGIVVAVPMALVLWGGLAVGIYVLVVR